MTTPPANTPAKPEALPAPHACDVAYGSHERQTFDLWLAERAEPTPLLFHFHGGGFQAGHKQGFFFPEFVPACLEAGISVASANYRLTPTAPHPAQVHDCVRALQHVRHQADRWNLDPQRVALGGGSAGSGISQWIAYHPDLADLASDDPVSRTSTRVRAVVALNMQCTYHPREVAQIVPGRAYDAVWSRRLAGLPDAWDWDRQGIPAEADQRLRDISPLTHLTAEAPPVFIFHNEANRQPDNIHHPNFGEHLKARLDELGVPCERYLDTDFDSTRAAMAAVVAFLNRHLR
ncbi:MAG: alpha/beta hydrolase [Phycisphaeraceae bacterium]